MTGRAEDGRSYALLADGTTLTIRPSGPGDYEAVRRLHEAMSPDNLYFRFFSASRVSAEREARRVCLEGRAGHGGAARPAGRRGGGSGQLRARRRRRAGGGRLAVADGMHRRGVATLLLEHLVSLARAHGGDGLHRRGAGREHADAAGVRPTRGCAMRRRLGNGVVELTMPIPRSCGAGRGQRLPGRGGRGGSGRRMWPAWSRC